MLNWRRCSHPVSQICSRVLGPDAAPLCVGNHASRRDSVVLEMTDPSPPGPTRPRHRLREAVAPKPPVLALRTDAKRFFSAGRHHEGKDCQPILVADRFALLLVVLLALSYASALFLPAASGNKTAHLEVQSMMRTMMPSQAPESRPAPNQARQLYVMVIHGYS